MSGDIPSKQARLLALLSGGRCAFPGCRIELWLGDGAGRPTAVLGEIAHIRGEKPSSARHDGSMTPAERNDYANLIYLCPNHHTEIDKNAAQWTTERLHEIKLEHESWVHRSLGEAMGTVTFAELDIITKAVAKGAPDEALDFTVVDPASKMARNAITASVGGLLRIGLANARVVAAYLDQFAAVDASIGERLKAGFVAEYARLVDDGASGDALFEGMHEFATKGLADFTRQAAGLAVLAYLFDTCEVFEK